MRLMDEFDQFLNTLKRNKNQLYLLEKNFSTDNSSENVKVTICLTIPTTFALAVIDGLQNTNINLPTTSTSDLSETDMKSVIVDDTCNVELDINEVATVPSICVSKTKIKSLPSNRSLDLSEEKKCKIESTIQRGLDTVPKDVRSSSISLSISTSDNSDDTSSQWDLDEDLNTELGSTLLINDFEEQQEKAMHIELDDDCMSLTEKDRIVTETLESVLFKNKTKEERIFFSFI